MDSEGYFQAELRTTNQKLTDIADDFRAGNVTLEVYSALTKEWKEDKARLEGIIYCPLPTVSAPVLPPPGNS